MPPCSMEAATGAGVAKVTTHRRDSAELRPWKPPRSSTASRPPGPHSTAQSQAVAPGTLPCSRPQPPLRPANPARSASQPRDLSQSAAHISVHRPLRRRLQKARRALYWRSVPPVRRKEPGPWLRVPAPPLLAGPADNGQCGHQHSEGEEWGGGCLRKNRFLCTSDVFITHKLGSTLTPARGSKPVWKEGAGCPVSSLTAPWASGLLASNQAPTGGRRCPQPRLEGPWEAPVRERRARHHWRKSHFKPWACNSTSSRPGTAGASASPAAPRELAGRRPGGAAGLKSMHFPGSTGTLSSDPPQPPPPSSRWSSCQTCRRASGRPPAPGSPACSNTCTNTGGHWRPAAAHVPSRPHDPSAGGLSPPT